MSELSRLRDVVVLAVGDVMLDEYLWGEVQRISPEAPVPVVEVRRHTHVPGGAANVAAGVAALGGRSFLAGVVGDDPAAAALRATLVSARVSDEDLIVDSSRPTTSKTRVIAHSQQVVRTDHEVRDPLPQGVESAVIERVRERIAQADAVVLSDYRKGVVSERLAQAVIAAGAEAQKSVIVDPKGLDYAKYRGATVITPNALDAGQAANVHVESEEDLREAARRLSERCDGAALLVTRGAQGMTLFSDSEPVHFPTRAQEVYDVTGAGDTVVTALAIALARGEPLVEAVELANTAAGIVVSKVGTSTVTLEELERALAG